MFSLRQITSLIQCGGPLKNLHNPVVILRGNSPKWSAVDTGWNVSSPGGTIRSTTFHPLTPPYEIGRELARRYIGLMKTPNRLARPKEAYAVIRPGDFSLNPHGRVEHQNPKRTPPLMTRPSSGDHASTVHRPSKFCVGRTSRS